MSQAVLCPVCIGDGQIIDKDNTANKKVACHGCGGKGWVEVEQDTAPYYPCYPSYPYYPVPSTYPGTYTTWRYNDRRTS